MISERNLARAFESVWQSLFPMLTPAFMRTFNEDFLKPIDTRHTGMARAVPVESNSPDLVSEFGIQLARAVVEGNVLIEDVAEDPTVLSPAWNKAQAVVARYEGELPDLTEVPMFDVDRDEGLGLADNLVAFVGLIDGTVQFSPSIPGANVLSQCEADLAVEDTLVEIKTVSRGFRSNDLRQLLVYLALDWVRGPQWRKGCLVNPRRAVWADFEVDWLVRRLSGRPAADTFGDFIYAFASGVELETIRF